MKELIHNLENFFGHQAKSIQLQGPAEINIVIADGHNLDQLSGNLQAHIIEMIDENTLAKINFLDESGSVIDSFSLNQ